MNASTPIPSHSLDESDYQAVRDLIELSIKFKEEQDCSTAIRTWHTAFETFREKERRIGLPQSEIEKHVYAAIVSELMMQGNILVAYVLHRDLDITPHGCDVRDLKARLSMLFDDYSSIARPLTEEQVAEMERIFAA